MKSAESPSEPVLDFNQFGLSLEVQKAMQEMGFTAPTPIQAQALPALMGESQDFIGLASTGTGKTAAFGIPLVELVDSSIKDTQGLVLSPTRELAIQVSEQLQKLGKHKGVRVATIYGGASYTTQMSAVQRGAHIVVATPGRLVDFLENKKISLRQVKTVVLDEADEMISMGFKDDLEFILQATHAEAKAVETDGETVKKSKQTRASCKTWLFSATMSREIRRVADQYLHNPVTVQINKADNLSQNIEQVYYTVRPGSKTELIGRLLQIHADFYGIIFCQTKLEVVQLCDHLNRHGFATDALHGDRSQKEREITLRKFRNREVQCIVATDVAARGLDVKDLTHVINYSLPWDTESYIHRIGRTGRNGQKGIAVTLVGPDQIRSLKRIQVTTKTEMKKAVIPRRSDVAQTKVDQVMKSMQAISPEYKSYKLASRLVRELLEKAVQTETTAFQTVEDTLARMLVLYQAPILQEDDKDLDFLGADRIPREMSGESSGGYDDNRPRQRRSSFRPRFDRPERSHGDRPERSHGDRPTKTFSDKSERTFNDRTDRPTRPARSFDGDRKPAFKPKFKAGAGKPEWTPKKDLVGREWVSEEAFTDRKSFKKSALTAKPAPIRGGDRKPTRSRVRE